MVRLVVLVVLAFAGPAFAQVVQPLAATASAPQVIDGHTLEIAGTIVRIFGIEAPERDQLCRVPQGRWSCGEHARSALQDLIRDRPVACAPVREDVFAGVTVARCSVAGRDIGATMVAGGWAVSLQGATREYVAQEAKARAAGAGLWRDNAVAVGYLPQLP